MRLRFHEQRRLRGWREWAGVNVEAEIAFFRYANIVTDQPACMQFDPTGAFGGDDQHRVAGVAIGNERAFGQPLRGWPFQFADRGTGRQ